MSTTATTTSSLTYVGSLAAFHGSQIVDHSECLLADLSETGDFYLAWIMLANGAILENVRRSSISPREF